MLTKIVLILLSSISNLCLVTCLLCTTCTDITLSFNNAAELPTKCEEKLVEAIACQAIFRTNYLTKEIQLNLVNGKDLKRNYDLYLSVQNKFDEPKSLNINTTYTCNITNDCAKVFYKTTIQKLIQNEPILNEIRIELYDSTKVNVEQCSDNQDQSITCENGYGCHGFEIIEDGKFNYEGECRNATTVTILPRLFFAITLVQGDPSSEVDWNYLGFTCNKQSLCNTRQQLKKMVKLANDFYPWKLIDMNSGTEVSMVYNYLLFAATLAVYIFSN